jgi:hypothetical protein
LPGAVAEAANSDMKIIEITTDIFLKFKPQTFLSPHSPSSPHLSIIDITSLDIVDDSMAILIKRGTRLIQNSTKNACLRTIVMAEAKEDSEYRNNPRAREWLTPPSLLEKIDPSVIHEALLNGGPSDWAKMRGWKSPTYEGPFNRFLSHALTFPLTVSIYLRPELSSTALLHYVYRRPAS